MATIANLVVTVTAQTKGLTSGLQSAGKSIAKFAKGMGGAILKAVKFAAVIGGAVVASLAIMVTKALQSLDATAKLADDLGTTTEKVSALGFAAQINGSKLEILTKGLQKMNRNLGEARLRGGDAAIAFQALGLETEKLAGQDPSDTFLDIADAIKGLGNQSDKTSATVAIFGRAGQDLLKTLDQGSGSIRELMAEADELGITFSRIDAAKAEEANDTFARLKALFEGFVKTLAVKLAPFIDTVAKKLLAMGKGGIDAAGIIKKGMKFVAQAIAFVIDLVRGFKVAFLVLKLAAILVLTGITAAVFVLAKALFEVLNFFGLVADKGKFAQFVDGAEAAVVNLAEQAAETTKSIQEVAAAPSALNAVNKAFEETEKNGQKLAETNAKIQANTNTLTESFVDAQKRIKATGAVIAKLTKQVADFGKSSNQLSLEKLINAGGSADQIAEAQGLIAQFDKLKAAEAAAKERKKSEDEIVKSGQRVFDETRKPMEKFQKRIDALAKLFEKGAINQETFNRASKAAGENIVKEPEDLTRGSFQVVKRNRTALNSQLKPLQTEAAKAQRERERQTKIQERIHQALQAGVKAVAS
jgi:hypothetical protein